MSSAFSTWSANARPFPAKASKAEGGSKQAFRTHSRYSFAALPNMCESGSTLPLYAIQCHTGTLHRTQSCDLTWHRATWFFAKRQVGIPCMLCISMHCICFTLADGPGPGSWLWRNSWWTLSVWGILQDLIWIILQDLIYVAEIVVAYREHTNRTSIEVMFRKCSGRLRYVEPKIVMTVALSHHWVKALGPKFSLHGFSGFDSDWSWLKMTAA